MHEIIEILGHLVRFGVGVAALGCGIAALARSRMNPKSIPLAVGLGGFGLGDLTLLAFEVVGFGAGSRYLISGYFVLVSLALLAGIPLIGAWFQEDADAQ